MGKSWAGDAPYPSKTRKAATHLDRLPGIEPGPYWLLRVHVFGSISEELVLMTMPVVMAMTAAAPALGFLFCFGLAGPTTGFVLFHTLGMRATATGFLCGFAFAAAQQFFDFRKHGVRSPLNE
ncbi:hypothetical protein [Micavibrio aeruginosavorus]|uniref:hypothetical protein n=1 Tax=Micavibrio aeruginosavorus TaxID=349221 RepID=UPI003F4AA685